MAKKQEIIKLTEELLEPIITEKNYELVDVEYEKEGANWFLKVYVDKEGGITVDDCEYVSRKLEVLLDEKDPIKEAYILEVSSPGLDRPLKKEKDFDRSIGKKVEVKLYKPIDGEREFDGELIDYKDNIVSIKKEDESIVTLNRKDIALIRLAVIF